MLKHNPTSQLEGSLRDIQYTFQNTAAIKGTTNKLQRQRKGKGNMHAQFSAGKT